MAETTVSLLVDRLIAILAREVKLPRGSEIQREITGIKDELESISCFLRDADDRLEKEHTESGVKAWLKQVREAAYQIEDVIDEYFLLCKAKYCHNRPQGCDEFLYHKILPYVRKFIPSGGVISKIKHLKTMVQDIRERSQRYSFRNMYKGQSSGTLNETMSDPRTGSLFIEETELVGIESPRDELINLLLDGKSNRIVIALVGMGGLGKTTLAKKVHENEAVRDQFDCMAWITVSQSYNVEELLRITLKQLYKSKKESPPEGLNLLDAMSLISQTREYLLDKRYMVVFDDVWRTQFWGDVEHALLDNRKGSRIMLTTRNKDVAEFCKKSSVVNLHAMKALPLKLGQELLCKKAFQFDDPERRCPKELEELSFDIVRRCQGLPLAIAALGGLLSTKGRDLTEWQNLHSTFISQLDSNPHLMNIKRIISLSYLDLPHFLRSCFLYLGMFPEDYPINCARLVRLWVAEGFVKGKRGMTPEEVAGEYLTELIHRNLVHVANTDSEGKVRHCGLHDLMREIILSRSEELSLQQVSPNNCMILSGIARHLSLNVSAKKIQESTSRSQTRSVITFKVGESPNPLVARLFANLKLLRVVDFQEAPIDYIPEALGDLLYLRYLSLRDTKVKTLPKSTRNLCNLETLDLKRTLVSELPVEIDRFPKLINLLVYYKDFDRELHIHTRTGMKIKGNIRCLESLMKLYMVETHMCASLIEDLGYLKQLKKLGISKLRSEDGHTLCKALENMNQLRSLSVFSLDEDEFLELEAMSSPPFLLQHLWLRGRLEAFPKWIYKLKILTKIRLGWSRLKDDPLQVLQTLPNLVDVRLYNSYDGTKLHFREGHFLKLKFVRLRHLNNLNQLIIDKGALPVLEKLAIGCCPQLEKVPSDIHHLRGLKDLQFHNMPRDFVVRMLPDGGEDHPKVKHIPSVFFHYRIGGLRYKTFHLGDSFLLEFLC